MRWETINLDIDGSIPLQQHVLEQIQERVDLRASEQKLRLWALGRDLNDLRRVIVKLRCQKNLPWLTLFGTGDLHYLTGLLIESLPESAKPVTLVLLDNHPDWFRLPPRHHCGNWVSSVLEKAWVKQAILVGQDSSDLQGFNFWMAPFDDLRTSRLTVIPYEREQSWVPIVRCDSVQGVAGSQAEKLGTRLVFDSVRSIGVRGVCSRLRSMLNRENVYISIDKDVFSTDYALTDWDQGRLRLDELVEIVQTIAETNRIVGADICGEKAPQPLTPILKRIDAGRLGPPAAVDWARVNGINQKTNLVLLKLFERISMSTSVAGVYD